MFWNRRAGPPGLPCFDLLTRSVISAISRMGSTSVWMRFSSPARSRAAIHWRRASKGKWVSRELMIIPREATVRRFARGQSQRLKQEGRGGTRRKSEFGAEHGDYVISGDYADELAAFVNDGEGDEVVFVEKFGDFVIAGSFVGREGGLR